MLLVVNDANPTNHFGRYLGEILRAEGLNAFDVEDLSVLQASDLTNHSVTILAQTALTGTQPALFNSYVTGGGHLIAMRPDPQINSLFGLAPVGGTVNNGYLQIQTGATYNGATPGSGLSASTLQIHGDADEYSLVAGAVKLAQLYSDVTTTVPYAAVVGANSGSGQAVAFTYDLASNVLYTRQGNPANADKDVDCDFAIRTIDLFQSVQPFTYCVPGAPWVDLDRVSIPQADEQQRLFARLVEQMVGQVHPMPRLWYFPDTAKTMLVLTGDAHANPDTLFQGEIASMDAHQGKITLYLSQRLNPWDPPSNAELVAWQAEGHTFGLHPWLLDGSTLAAGYAAVDTWFKSRYTVPESRTVRNHRLAWYGWTGGAETAATYGIAMDTSFYNWGPWLKKSDGSWAHGYITGSGQPMKFMRTDGTLLPVYQQLTELADEQLLTQTDTNYENVLEGLNAVQALAVSEAQINASLAGDYAAIMTQNHVDYYSGEPQWWAEGLMDFARGQGIPVWNADQWLNFTETRHDANYSNFQWDSSGHILGFTLVATPTTGVDLTTILPLSYAGNNLTTVTMDTVDQVFSIQTINGERVAFVSSPAGPHTFIATYGAAPDLAVSVTDGVASAAPGDQLTYTLNITNTGAQAANVVITDSLPVSVTFQSATGGVTPDANNMLTWSQPSLGAGGGTAQYTVTVKVANPIGAGISQLVNQAEVSATDTGVSLASDTDSVTGAPDFAVSETDGVTSAAPGDVLTYTLNITNTRNRGATSVVVTDSLPVSVTFQSATGGITPDANNMLTWYQASLAGAGGTAQYAVAVRVANPIGAGISQLVNQVGVKDGGTNGADPNLTNNVASDTDSVVNAAPNLQITKADGVTSATPGDLLTYTLNITNTGNQDAANVVITDSLPVSVTFQSATGGVTPDANNMLTWTRPSLTGGGGLGATAQYTVTVRVANPMAVGISQLVNRAGVSAAGTGVSLASDTDTVVTVPYLQITKTDGVTSAAPNDLLTYTLNITNTGNGDAANAVITDSLPVSVTFQSATGGVTPDANNMLTWSQPSLGAGGGTAQYTVTVKVANPIGAGISQLVNRAGVSATRTSVIVASDTDSVTGRGRTLYLPFVAR